MSDDTNTLRSPVADQAAHLITLFTQQDTLIHNWIKTLLTIKSALAVAFIFLLKDFNVSATSLPRWFGNVLDLGIPFFGIAFSLIIGNFLVRELKWQRWFSDSYNQLHGWDQAVFPSREKRRVEPNDQRLGFLSFKLLVLSWALAVVWCLIGGTTAYVLFWV